MSGASYLDLYHSGIERTQFGNFWISKPNSNAVLDYIENNVGADRIALQFFPLRWDSRKPLSRPFVTGLVSNLILV
jgi:hypothetical protein